MATHADTWDREFKEASRLAEDVMANVQERNSLIKARQDPSRLTAFIRRKITMLGTKADKLESMIQRQDGQSKMSDQEIRRREEMIRGVRYQAKELASLVAPEVAANRSSLLGNTVQPQGVAHWGSSVAISSSSISPDRPLDNRRMISLQQQAMLDQDDELLELESTVASTRNIALTINGELDLHSRLLDDIDADVTSTGARLKMVKRKVGFLLKNSDRTCNMLLVMMLAAVAVFLATLIYFFLKAL